MARLLATDIDDTLLAPDGSLPPANHDALVRLHDAGVIIVFCSGRSDVSIRGVASRILAPADNEYYIAFNGARTVTADTRRVVTRSYVRAAAVGTAVRYARRHGLHIQGYDGDEFLVERHSAFVDLYAAATGTAYRVVDDLTAALPDGSPKLLIHGAHEVLVPHRAALKEMGGADGFVPMFSKPVYLELVAPGVNKGQALVSLAAALGIPVEETVAVGDGENDAQMIRAAGTGLAVAGATEGARAAADLVLEASAGDGIMPEIERRFFSGSNASA